ncbi:hypothetical protein HDV01_005462 [Terramyces sp. JEL0728]|nr:hypothetical protein HDV01_005462 [Terramyces sp. JEL0728]
MTRQDSAYVTPAAIFLGLALHDIVSSLYLLLSKVNTAYKTPIWRVASVTWIFMAIFFVCQFIILDYITSPYVVSNDFFGNLMMLNYIFNYFVTVGVGIMLMTRIRVFYGRQSAVYIIMLILAVATFTLKGMGDTYGTIVGNDMRKNLYLQYESHPLYHYVPFYLAIGQAIEAVFATMGAVAFLYAIGNGVGQSKTKIITEIVIKEDGIRLFIIFCLEATIAVFGIMAWLNGGIFTYITHVGLYIPSFVYALQFYTFLQNSYVTAKSIIEKQQNSSSQGNSRAYSESRQTSLKPYGKSQKSGNSSTPTLLPTANQYQQPKQYQQPSQYQQPNQFQYTPYDGQPNMFQKNDIKNPYTPPSLSRYSDAPAFSRPNSPPPTYGFKPDENVASYF